jgi:hypothetical protein
MYSRALGPHRSNLTYPEIDQVFATKQESVYNPDKGVSMSRLHVFWAIVALNCVAIGATIAWPNIAGSTGARPYVTKADFDQAFADAAAWRRESEPTIRKKFREAAAKEVAARSPKPSAGTIGTWTYHPFCHFEQIPSRGTIHSRSSGDSSREVKQVG